MPPSPSQLTQGSKVWYKTSHNDINSPLNLHSTLQPLPLCNSYISPWGVVVLQIGVVAKHQCARPHTPGKDKTPVT